MTSTIPTPLALIAELTHRCPLHCVYCSNPLEMQSRGLELSTDDWSRVLREAAEAGVLQVDFTGGEPLARPDLVELVRSARAAGLYVNLITSGLPLDEARLAELVNAGLDHLQLSFQGAQDDAAAEIAGTRALEQKLKVVKWVQAHRIALTLNFVIHRQNLDRLEEMIALGEASGAGRMEFAHVQYYGWAFANRKLLLPTRDQVDRSIRLLQQTEARLRGKVRVEYVTPDYYAKYPKACMGGWGRKLMLITPSGDVLPCHAAQVIPGLRFENVKNRALQEIWNSSEAFQKFRGEAWMSEPCRSCDRRALDFGGCRCQAFLLGGDAAVTDPVCTLTPQRQIVEEIIAAANTARPEETAANPAWLYRPNPA
ncbi:MAG TPA: pyrroloquinoline quinone biosynthesis protein PqqE [Candidatus Acidoferrales bacterium]|nr:pyrroloquinoline quinone biosynthesis protein PqqE [Candidatus Acidoferrales bacterium]